MKTLLDIAFYILNGYVKNLSNRDGNEDRWQELADIAKVWQVKKYQMVINDMDGAYYSGNVYENEKGSFENSFNSCLNYFNAINDDKKGHEVLIEYGKNKIKRK